MRREYYAQVDPLGAYSEDDPLGAYSASPSDPLGVGEHEVAKPEEDEGTPVEFNTSPAPEPMGSFATPSDDEGGYVPEISQQEDDSEGMSYFGQIMELLEAPRNLTDKAIDKAIAGDKPVSDNGKHNARSFRANVLKATDATPNEKAKLGYGADQSRSWRDDLNTMLFEPFNPNRDKAISDLGKRASDSAFDLSYELATDPLNYISGALGLGKKVAKAAGIASKAGEASKIVKAGKAMAFGGALGAANDLSHDKDDPKPYIGTVEGAALGLVPGAIGAGFAALNSAGNKAVKSMLDGKTAEYMGKMVDLSQYPALKPTVDQIKKKSDYIAHMIRQGYRKSLSGLSDEEAVQVNQFMSNAKDLSNELSQGAYFEQAKSIVGDDAMSSYRDQAIKNLQKKYAGDEAREITEQMINTETADIALATQDPSGAVKRYVWNQSRDIANKAIATDPRFIEMSSGLSSKGLKATEDWVAHNRSVRADYNKAKGYEDTFDPNINIASKKYSSNGVDASKFIAQDGVLQPSVPVAKNSKLYTTAENLEKLRTQPMTGLDYHTADVYDREAFEVSKKLFSGEGQAGFKRGLHGGESDAVQRMIAEGVPPREAYDRAYSVYSDQAGKAFLDNAEKEAMFIVNQGSKYFKDLPLVSGYDALTTAFKKKVLYLNNSWVKNQYWDNVLRTLVEGGYINSARFAAESPFRKELANDISKVMEGSPLHVSSDKANKYIKLGVVDGSYNIEANSLTDTEMALRYGKKEADNSFAGKVNKTSEYFLSRQGIKQISNITAGLGQRFENNARIMTFERLTKEGIPEEQAAKMVQKAFFNYSDVTAFEKELTKRFIPFYGFMSKNLQYWPEAITDVNKLSRLNNAITASRQLGSGSAERNPDFGQAIGDSNSYLKNGYPQIDNSSDDYTTLYSAPKLSFFDAIASLTDPTKIAQGVSPLLRAPVEAAFGYDLFSKQRFDPAKNPGGKANWLPSTGYAGNLLNKVDPNFTSEFSLRDLIEDDSPKATLSNKAKRLLKGGISAALGQTGVRANEKTGNPETTSSLPMYYSKLGEMIPFAPPVGGVGTLYNTVNSPFMRGIYKSLDNLIANPDDSKTPAKAIDIPLNYLAPFDVIRKDTSDLEKKQRKIEKGDRDAEKERNKDQRIRGK